MRTAVQPRRTTSPTVGNRQTTNHHVHAHCVNEGLGHDHELLPKQATDQDAVDAVARQRETIIRTAADTEVLLPFAQDPDQASTAALPDDGQDLCGREEALRMDEEIMNFQWFDNVKCEARRTFSHHQGSSLPCSKHNRLSCVPSFTVTLPHWHPSQPGKRSCSAASFFWDDLQSMRLRATVLTTWMQDWNSSGRRLVWAMVRAECDVAPVQQNATRRTATKQKHSRIRNVATLARAGEKGRALAARNAPAVPVTEQIVQEIKKPYPTDPEPPAPLLRRPSCQAYFSQKLPTKDLRGAKYVQPLQRFKFA